MKKIVFIALMSTLALAQSNIRYQSKSSINVVVEGDLQQNRIDQRNCRNKKCHIYMLGKSMYINEDDIVNFKKNAGNYVRMNCNYNQRTNAIENCKIVSVRKWEKPETIEIEKR